MKYFVRQTKQYALNLIKGVSLGGAPKKLTVFETETGVKYRNGRFDSRRFHDYLLQDVPVAVAKIPLFDLVLPPDLLRDSHTLCGRSLLHSPHYQLTEEIVLGTLTTESEYVTRTLTGTLDARLPQRVSIEFLTDKSLARQRELSTGEMMTIYIVKVSIRNEVKYVIADGKHRAAVVAYCKRPELLRLLLISNEFIYDPFFSQAYSFVLNMDPAEYSINQEMIRAIQNES